MGAARLGLGCVGLGTGRVGSVEHDVRLVRSAIDLGVTVFDTADAYGAGASERVLGRALKGHRDDVVLATKGGFAFRDRTRAEQLARRWAKTVIAASGRGSGVSSGASQTQYAQQDFSPRHLRDAVRDSLRRLRTDHIDVYQLHAPPQVLPGLLEKMSDLVAVGDVGRFGVGAPDVRSAVGWMTVPGVSVVQLPFGILDQEAASEALPLARANDREVWARGVFGGGLLAAADRDSLSRQDPKWRQIQELRRVAAAAGLDQYQLAFGFVRSRAEFVSTVLVGSTSVAHVRRNVALLEEPPLDDQVLRAAVEAYAGSAPVEEHL